MTNSEDIEILKESANRNKKSLEFGIDMMSGKVLEWVTKETEALTKAIELLEAEEEVERLRASILSCGCQYCLDGIDIIQMKFPNTHECGGTWWTASVRTPKYCPMCGRKLSEAAEQSLKGNIQS